MLSIITICYNSEKTISRTLDSILEQIYIPKQCIIIDGCSNDKTISIITDYQKEFRNKNIDLIFISEKDTGIYDAMNKGISYVTQEWIHFLNSDDYYANKYVLEIIEEKLKTTDADILYGQLIKIKSNTQSVLIPPKEKKIKLNALISCPIYQPATFFRSSLFKKKYFFDTSYRISADYKLFLEMLHDNIKFQYIPVFITNFDEGGISSTNKNTLTYKEDLRVLKEIGKPTLFMRFKHTPLLYKPLILIFQIISKF